MPRAMPAFVAGIGSAAHPFLAWSQVTNSSAFFWFRAADLGLGFQVESLPRMIEVSHSTVVEAALV